MSWSGVGGNPPPLKDDLGPPASRQSYFGGRGSGRRGLSRSAPVTYSESSCGNWFALSTCHICTPCSKYWPLLYWKDSYILWPERLNLRELSRSSSARMFRWPAWAVSLFVCKQLSPFKILISGRAFKLKVCTPLTTDQKYSVTKIIKEAKSYFWISNQETNFYYCLYFLKLWHTFFVSLQDETRTFMTMNYPNWNSNLERTLVNNRHFSFWYSNLLVLFSGFLAIVFAPFLDGIKIPVGYTILKMGNMRL